MPVCRRDTHPQVDDVEAVRQSYEPFSHGCRLLVHVGGTFERSPCRIVHICKCMFALFPLSEVLIVLLIEQFISRGRNLLYLKSLFFCAAGQEGNCSN